jgi:TNF receptor-associated protein 1
LLNLFIYFFFFVIANIHQQKMAVSSSRMIARVARLTTTTTTATTSTTTSRLFHNYSNRMIRCSNSQNQSQQHVRTFASEPVREAEIADETPKKKKSHTPKSASSTKPNIEDLHLNDPTKAPPMDAEAEETFRKIMDEGLDDINLTRRKDAPPFKTEFTPEEKASLQNHTDTIINPEPEVPQIPRPTSTKSHSFQAETAQLLRIVTHSIYTDKEVFLRELISNGSDALEKVRYLQSTGEKLLDPELPLEIRITVDTKNKCISITDTGIGMNDEEIISNLGTIARSGSRQFMQEVTKKQGAQSDTAGNIIGQFGVGFYSSFMVSGEVEVVSAPGRANSKGADKAYYWKSTGTGDYELAEVERKQRGTTLILHVRDDCQEFVSKSMVETIIKKYSNFVNFPIYLNDEKVNTLGAIWTMPKDSVSDELHGQFYRFIANSYDYPTYRLHFSVDAPLSITALLYFPERHMERFGLGRMEPSVSLYSRRVLIQSKCKELLPDWLRFMKGVVDSEDIPLNLSRESMQDTRLLGRLKAAVTKRILKFLIDQSVKDPVKYEAFYKEYTNFLKEGVITDAENRKDIAKLIRFDSNIEKDVSKTASVSFDDYIGRMPPSQKNIYFLQAPSRELAFSSPYYESVKDKGMEVLFLYSPMDDFVMRNLGEFNGRKLMSVEGDEAEELNNPEDSAKKAESAVFEQSMIDFFKTTLENRVSEVKSSSRLKESPAIIVSSESSAFRKMMRYVEQESGQKAMEIPKQKLEINTKHPILITLKELINKSDMESRQLAQLVVEQIFDDALIQADLMENPTSMIPRLNKLMETALAFSITTSKLNTEVPYSRNTTNTNNNTK